MKAKSCALVAGAAAALVPAAHASIITTSVGQTVVPGSYDLTSNGGPDLTFSGVSGAPDGLTESGDVAGNGSSEYAVDMSGNPLDVAGGTVSGSNSFATAQGVMASCKFLEGCSGNFPTDGSTQYLGFEFTPSTTTDYGYVTLSVTGNAIVGPVIDLVSFTYDDSGAPITVPQASDAPEPSALALLAAGAAGIAALRSRRRKPAR